MQFYTVGSNLCFMNTTHMAPSRKQNLSIENWCLKVYEMNLMWTDEP